MEKELELFEKISEKLSKKSRIVKPGKIMSAPGLSYKKKFFAFYFKKQITLKLGKDFDPKEYGIKKWSHLNPFKNKAPMKNWFQIPYTENKKWEGLAKIALNFVVDEIKKT